MIGRENINDMQKRLAWTKPKIVGKMHGPK
jgi:hypothetical protein